MSSKKFIINGKNISTATVERIEDQIPPFIYKLNLNPFTGFYLTIMSEKFELPEKVYGSDHKFAERVISTFDQMDTNMGVVLAGTKGTGKTVTAKVISNISKLPVIVIDANMPGFDDFIQAIDQDLVVFVDEFEKTFDQKDQSMTPLLTMMDGVNSTVYKRLFVLTTNGYINELLNERPGRVRYKKNYDILSIELIREIVEDKLVHKDLIEQVVEAVARIRMITMDILTKVIEEVNIHKESPTEFMDFFNVQTVDKNWRYEFSDDEGKTWKNFVYGTNIQFSGAQVYVNGQHVATGIPATKYITFNKDGIVKVRMKKGKEKFGLFKRELDEGFNSLFRKEMSESKYGVGDFML